MKPTILLINFQDQQKLRKLKMALLPFKLRIKTIEPQKYSQPIGYLAYSANRFEKRSGDRWRILLLPKSPKRTVRRQMPLI